MKHTIETKKQILLIDDEPIVLNTLAGGLEKLGYTVYTCDSSKKALTVYQQTTPDLVVLDYRLPEMDGLTLARTLLNYSHRPIIMLSAYNDLPLVRDAVSVGVSSYLVKPIEAERLAPSIEAAIARFAEMSALLARGENLQAGFENHRIINVAVGIVMAETNRSNDLAFECLRRYARNHRRKLRDVAVDLVDSFTTANSLLIQLEDTNVNSSH